MTRPSGRSTNQPGAVPFGLGSAVADGISQACLRLSSGNGIPRRDHSSRSQASRSGSTSGVSPHAAAIASRVRSSGVGPEPAGRDDEVGPAQAGRERLGHLVEVVGEGGQAGDPDAHPGQRAGQLPGVRVARLADGQLAADAQQLGGQESAAFEGCHVFAA